MAVLSNPSNNATNPLLLTPRTDAYDGAQVTYSGVYDAPTSTWTLVPRRSGEESDGRGRRARAARRLREGDRVAGSSPTGALQNPAWNFTVATRTGMHAT